MMVEETEVCRGLEVEASSGDPGEPAHHDARRLVVIALVPPEPGLDPPPVLALIVEQAAAAATNVVFEFYLSILLHTDLDCVRAALVPCKNAFFGPYSGSNSSETPFMQYRKPVGRGPSAKTWPRWPLQREQWTSVRSIPRVRSVVVSTAFVIGAQKLGHPVPLSNFVSEVKSSWPHPAQRKIPARCSEFRRLVPARSVPWLRRTRNCSGDSRARHSSSFLGMSIQPIYQIR
jgi:hypothetical protein